LEQFEIAVSVSFSHAQVDPQVEALDDAAVIELPGLEIAHAVISGARLAAFGASGFAIGSWNDLGDHAP
jgi:hypothetical protein